MLTLRQLKDARFFFHNGAFTSVKDVVRYFNAGVPQDAVAAAAGTLTRRFTHPRGPGSPRGLGLSDDQANTGASPVDTHLLVIARGLSFDIEMTNASGRTSSGDPYRRVYLPDGVLAPGQSVEVALRFRRHRRSPPVSFTLTLLSGQGNP